MKHYTERELSNAADILEYVAQGFERLEDDEPLTPEQAAYAVRSAAVRLMAMSES